MEAQTHAIALTRGLLRPNFSVLNGKKVLLAYHEPTERVFVIRILSESQYYPYGKAAIPGRILVEKRRHSLPDGSQVCPQPCPMTLRQHLSQYLSKSK